MDYSELTTKLQTWIERGESEVAKKALLALPIKTVSRQYKVKFANLAWRCGAPYWGLKLLSPLVVSEQALASGNTTDLEKLEYAVLLQKIGSVNEAEYRLSQISGSDLPKSLLYRAFCNFSKWNYEKATPLLETYYGNKFLSSKDQAIAGINLFASYIGNGDFQKAINLSGDLENALIKNQYRQLLGNYYELTAQMNVFNSDYKMAGRYLEKSKSYLASDSSFGSLFLGKWQAFLKALETNSTAPLMEFKKRAIEANHSEVIRDCDLLTLKVQFSEKKFDELIYGTPYETFHKRALNFLGIERNLPMEKIIGPNSFSPLHLFFAEKESKAIMSPGKDLHRLLYSLTCDFYRPISLAGIHEKVFEGEFFNVFSSPNKIHQLLFRLRKVLRDENLALELNESRGLYFMKNKGESLVSDLQKNMPCLQGVSIKRAQSAFSRSDFSREQFCSLLRVSKSTGRRIIKAAQEEGILLVENQGKQTRYKFKENEKYSVKKAS